MSKDLAGLPTGWKVVKIGDDDIGYTSSGGTPDRSNPKYFDGDILWVKSGELNDNWIYDTEEKITQEGLKNSSAKIFPAETLLLAMYGATAGKTAILGKEATTNQAVCAIFPKNDVFNSQFLQFYLMLIRPYLLGARSGGAQPNINQRIINLCEITLPPLEEQRAIATTLSTIQTAKESRQKELVLERERKAALMDYLFTHGTCNEPCKQTELGEIPESWEVIRLGEIVKLKSGTSRPDNLLSNPTENTNVPVFGGNGILGYTSQIFSSDRQLVIGRVGAYCGCVHIAEAPNWITD